MPAARAWIERHVLLAGSCAFLLVAGLARIADYRKPVNPDTGQFLYVGETVGQGGMPYADAAYSKGPLTALLFAIVDPLVGGSPSAVHLSLIPFAAVAALALAGYVADHAGRAAGALAGLAYAAFSGMAVVEGAEGKTEQYGVAPMFAALWLATRAGPAASAGTGALVACAALIHPALALVVPAVALELWLGAPRGERLRRVGLATLGALAPVAATATWLVAGGAFDDALGQIGNQVDESTAPGGGSGSASVPDVRLHLPADELWLLALVGCAVAARDRRLRRPAIALALVVGATLARVKLAQYEFTYQYYPALPAICGAIALGVASLWPSRGSLRVLLAIGVLAFPLWHRVIEPQERMLGQDPAERVASGPARERVVDVVRTRTRASDPIFVVGGWADVYWRADRRAPTRFFDSHGPTDADDSAERDRALFRHPPAAFVVVPPDRLASDPPVKRIVEDGGYVRALDREGAQVWLRPPPK